MSDWRPAHFIVPDERPMRIADAAEPDAAGPLVCEAEHNAATGQWRARLPYAPGGPETLTLAGEVVAADPVYAAALLRGWARQGQYLTKLGRRKVCELLAGE